MPAHTIGDYGLFCGTGQCKFLENLWEKIMADMEKVSLYISVLFIMTNFEVTKRFKTLDLFLVEINQERYPKVHKKSTAWHF